MTDPCGIDAGALEEILRTLPDEDGARRFFGDFHERHPVDALRLMGDRGLLSDVLTVAAFSPLLAATVLQHPDYIWWLGRRRLSSAIPSTEELLESLARFALTNSDAEPQVLLARFRRRELLRIFLRDVRRLATISETTEDISSLADAILAHALAIARQDLENRFGSPLVRDADGRLSHAEFCVVSLGKLGSRELNYSSDIDLVFLYSAEGETSGAGSRGSVTNREFFVKLSEKLIGIVGGQAGEGAAYRVDMRLRPHGRVGALAVSADDAATYYRSEAQDWERQVLIRSRASAGDTSLFDRFSVEVSASVFSTDQSPSEALRSVRASKDRIDREHQHSKGFNVKLGHGGIREIEFIAQALQLAHGGRDRWLRAPHTLISLTRLADRGLVTDRELTELFDAYEFLREVEHVLQMEHGLQTHVVPEDPSRRDLLARRMGFKRAVRFDESLAVHSGNVRRIFTRIFGEESDGATPIGHETPVRATPGVRAPGTDSVPPVLRQLLDSVAKSEPVSEISESGLETLRMLADRAPHFAEMLAAHPSLAASLERQETGGARDYAAELGSAADSETAFRGKLAALRRTWSRMILEIAVLDIGRRIDVRTAKAMQTALAEASIDVALRVAAEESRARFGGDADGTGYAVLGLGKLGGRGVDYGSDLDVVIVHDDDVGPDSSERHSRMVEIFTEVLGGVTREGHLYRIDLRLRPNGKSGPAAVGRSKIEEYFRTHAAVWEWLAYVKVRHAGGDRALGEWVEGNLRATIYRRAAELGPSELAAQTRSVRDRLEKERSSLSTAKEIDIKFGAGGLLDVYFATRFLQLRGGIPEEGEDRSTKAALDSLLRLGLLGTEDHEALAFGYALLSDIDHTVRLAVGRSTRVSLANHEAMRAICRQTGFEDPEALKDALDSARRRVRAAFLNVVS